MYVEKHEHSLALAPRLLGSHSLTALELLQKIGGFLRHWAVDAELGIDPDRLPGALKRPRIVTTPLLRMAMLW